MSRADTETGERLVAIVPRRPRRRRFALTLAGAARAEDLQTYSLTLKNHRFSPSEIHVPSGKPFIVSITNLDDTADEFDMPRPAVEKVIPPGGEGKVRIRPLRRAASHSRASFMPIRPKA